MKKSIIIGLISLLSACTSSEKKPQEVLIQEIKQVEEEFNNMAARQGLNDAFLHFAADNAVLNRRGGIIKGKQQIADYFDSQTLQEVSLKWNPEFIDVASSGDMAYTYGPFTFSAMDTTGQKIESNGYFHTVWKRQNDGSWKYVYD